MDSHESFPEQIDTFRPHPNFVYKHSIHILRHTHNSYNSHNSHCSSFSAKLSTSGPFFSHLLFTYPGNFLIINVMHPVLSTADLHTPPEVRPHYNNLLLSCRCMQQISPEFHMHLLCPSVLHSQCSF